MAASILDYLTWSIERTIPPLCLELVLKSGRSFWIAWVFRFGKDDPMITMRVWDMRAIGDDDETQLLSNMNALRDRNAPDYMKRLHPKLDQANLRIPPDSIECLVEWHDRIWPQDLRDELEIKGFHRDERSGDRTS